jgi:protein SCO1/2
MNRRAMTCRKLSHKIPLLFAAALLASCGGNPSPTPESQAPLHGSSIGGPFTLADSAGRTVRWSDFDGKYRIVYFGYTWCPDVCPTDVARIIRGYNRFKQAEPKLATQIVPIFISVDPERDTPAKVGEFAHAFSDDLVGLTGTPAQVKAAADAFKVYYQKEKPDKDGNYFVNHSTNAYLMGRMGEPIALLPDDVDDKGQAIAAELKKWIG